jgi:hypothetical protein
LRPESGHTASPAAGVDRLVAALPVVGIPERDFTAVGHALALLAGTSLSMRYGPAAHCTPTRVVLLVVGYVMITEAELMAAATAGPAGLLTVLIEQSTVRRWRGARRKVPPAAHEHGERQAASPSTHAGEGGV